MAFSPNEIHHPQLGEQTDARFWDSMVSVVYTGLEHMLSHYEPGGFPRIWTASDFPPSLWRHRMMVHGTVGKRSIEPGQTTVWLRLDIVSFKACLPEILAFYGSVTKHYARLSIRFTFRVIFFKTFISTLNGFKKWILIACYGITRGCWKFFNITLKYN